MAHKHCHTYDTLCTCPTCPENGCGYSDRTRHQAEAIRGVRLTRLGTEVEDSGAYKAFVNGLYSEPAEVPATRRPWTVAQRALAGTLVVVIFAGTYALLAPSRAPESAPEAEGVPQAAAAPAQATEDPVPPAELATRVPEPEDVFPAPRAVPPLIPVPTLQDDLRRLDELAETLKDQGNAVRLRGNVLEARKLYEMAVEQNPRYHKAWNNLGNTYNDTNMPIEAEPFYLRGLNVKPDCMTTRFNLGLSQYRVGRWAEALDNFAAVTSKDPSDFEARLLYGLAAYRLEDFPTAAKQFEQCVRLRPGNADPYYNLFLCYGKLGQAAVAFTYYQEAVRRNPRLSSVIRVGG